jgi:polynucleotide 5'-hydroxyl-kinase GRC3/NOL9
LKTVLIKGPVLLEIKGECNILGVKCKNECIGWESSRIIPVEKNNNSTLSIIRGRSWNYHNHEIIRHRKKFGISIWKDLVRNVLKQEKRRIIIIGPSNSGKSTLSLYMANVFINHGLKPLLIDADVGQGDLAPPTCLGASVMNFPEVDLWKVKTDCINFIGGIQPVGYESRIISNIRQQLDTSLEHDLSIINTDGYINGNGLIHKIDLLNKIQPDCIIYLGAANMDRNLMELFSHLSRNLKVNFMYGEKQGVVNDRSLTERYAKRMKTFCKFLNKDRVVIMKLDLSRINYIYYRNRFYSELKCLEECQSSNEMNEKILYIADKEFLKNRFVGFGNKIDNGSICGFGLIYDFAKGGLWVKANVKEFDTIFLSDTKLDIT